MDNIVAQSNTFVAEFAGAPAGRHYEAWREDVCREFCRVDAEPGKGDEIFCKVEIAQIASLALATAGGTSGRFLRTRDLMNDSRDDFVLFGVTSGTVLVTREGRAPAELLPSQMWLVDLAGVGAVAFNDDSEFMTIRIPRRELLSICPHAESRLAEPLLEKPGIRAIISRYFNLSMETAASLDPIGQQLTARHMIDLVALLLHTGQDETRLAARRGYSEARLQLIQAHVLECLDDSGLTVGSIAQRFGLSPKQVQRLFEQAGTTFSEFAAEQRLLLARRLLCSPGGRHDKIGSIAYGVGFSDLSYFNRRFRARFGMTPSEWRDGQPSHGNGL